MGFFVLPDPPEDWADDDPDDEPRLAAWIGGAVPLDLLVARSETAAVVARSIVAFPDGIDLTLCTYWRGPRERHGPFHLYGPDDWGAERSVPDTLLRVGLLWPDGGRATNIDHWGQPWMPDATEAAHGLSSAGGGGSDEEYELRFRAWPVPRPDGLQLIVEWPARGIDETFVDLPAAEIAAAAQRARPVWDDEAHLPRNAFMHFGWGGAVVHVLDDDEDGSDET